MKMENDLNIYFIGNNPLIQNSDIKTSTIEECYTYLKDKKIISLDIETTRKYGGNLSKEEGLDPYLSEIVMFQIGDKERQYIIDYRYIDITPLLPLLEDPKITKIGQNIKFEYKHILHSNNIRLNNLYDTMIAEQILFNGLNVKANLETLNLKYLNKQVDKTIRLDFLTIGDNPFTYKQITYGAEDILYPILIREQQLLDIDIKKINNCISLEMLFIPVLGDIEYKGMHFDQEKWKETYKENTIKSKKVKDELDRFVLQHYPDTNFIEQQLDLFSTEIKCSINWSSPKQTIDFFRYLNICPQEVSKTTKKLSYTVNANVLKASLNTLNKDIIDEFKWLIKTYLLYKETEQSCTTFGIEFFKYVNPITGRLHSNYRQILNTGRISSSNPNLQNIPASENEDYPKGDSRRYPFRRAFTAPKGYKIVNADYSGQEQIILANKSQDKDLIYFYEQDLGDMHTFVASKIFPELKGLSLNDIKKYHSDKRQIAKSAGFAINYGGNGHTIAKNLGISSKQGDEVYNAYFNAFPGLKNYFNKIKKETLRNGYILIDPITNRKNWFYKPKTSKEVGKIERAALNYPIQGEAGGITKFAPILFRNWILKHNLSDKISITNIVHDEINVECHHDYTELASKNLEFCMKKAGEKWCKIIPLEAKAVITDFWTH